MTGLSARMRKPTAAERRAALEALEKEVKAARSHAGGPDGKLPATGNSHKNPTRELTNFLNRSFFRDVSLATMENRTTAISRLRDLAFLLASYRRDHGRYPATLRQLVPHYVSELPPDPFSGADLHYRPEGKGYVLYSVGPNGRDDGGRNVADEISKLKHETYGNFPDYDDITIRTPEEEP